MPRAGRRSTWLSTKQAGTRSIEGVAGRLRNLAPPHAAELRLHTVREGHGGNDPTTRTHGLAQRRERPHEIGYVLQHVEGGEGVEGGVREVVGDVVDVAHERGDAQRVLNVAHRAGVEV